jgi:FtsZ-binding cell division protein ZapB
VKEKLSVLEMAELEYMKENEDYMQDFCLSMPQVIKIENLYEKATGLCKTLAEGNLEKEKSIEELQTRNQELQYEFDGKQEELKELLEAYTKKK